MEDIGLLHQSNTYAICLTFWTLGGAYTIHSPRVWNKSIKTALQLHFVRFNVDIYVYMYVYNNKKTQNKKGVLRSYSNSYFIR